MFPQQSKKKVVAIILAVIAIALGASIALFSKKSEEKKNDEITMSNLGSSSVQELSTNKMPNNIGFKSVINHQYATTTLSIKDTEFVAYVSDTEALREQGLSGQTGLLDNEAMIFIFPYADRYGFWMKDMKFSLDMIWIDANGAVIYIEKNATPESYPNAFIPSTPAQAVLEVKAGTSDQLNIKIGDKINFNKDILKKASK